MRADAEGTAENHLRAAGVKGSSSGRGPFSGNWHPLKCRVSDESPVPAEVRCREARMKRVVPRRPFAPYSFWGEGPF
nr:MAG: hypothetical protein DIU66_04910 [Bacillota bacterium]